MFNIFNHPNFGQSQHNFEHRIVCQHHANHYG
jgi:hypothetical protein